MRAAWSLRAFLRMEFGEMLAVEWMRWEARKAMFR